MGEAATGKSSDQESQSGQSKVACQSKESKEQERKREAVGLSVT